MKNKIFKLAPFLITIIAFFGIYAWYLPNKLQNDEPIMREYIELNGLVPVDMIEVNAWTSTVTWSIAKTDSLGKPVEKLIDLKLIRGVYTINPH